MAKKENRWPPMISPPGWLIESEMNGQGLMIKDLVTHTGVSHDEIQRIFSGVTEITPEFAESVEGMLSIGKSLLLRLVDDYKGYLGFREWETNQESIRLLPCLKMFMNLI